VQNAKPIIAIHFSFSTYVKRELIFLMADNTEEFDTISR
jgi:hypothetical protein